MATIQSTAVTISAQAATEMADAVAWDQGYQTNVENPNYHPNQWLDSPTNSVPDPDYDPNPTIPNPQTKAQFAQAWLDNLVKSVIRGTIIRYRKNVVVVTVDNNTEM